MNYDGRGKRFRLLHMRWEEGGYHPVFMGDWAWYWDRPLWDDPRDAIIFTLGALVGLLCGIGMVLA